MAIPYRTEIVTLLDELLGTDTSRFLAMAGNPNAPTIRLNPLKHSLSFQRVLLEGQGFRLEELPLIPHAYRVVQQPVPIGKSISHFLGHLYIQNQASMLPPLILNPQPGEKILDMCAAPGSKATLVASLMENAGVLVVNDHSGKRLRSLIFNLRRMGALNAIALHCLGEQLGNSYFEFFDRVLLDPPCSALGTLQKSPEVLNWWTPRRTAKLSAQQRQLVRSGLKALKPGGVLVYSTCTITTEENEEIIQYALEEFPVCLEEISFPITAKRPGLDRFRGKRFSPELRRALRLYPFESGTEGFFIVRLRKTGSFGEGKRQNSPSAKNPFVPPGDNSVASSLAQLSVRFDLPAELFERYHFASGTAVYCSCRDTGELPLHFEPASLGLPIASTRTGFARITTEGSHLFGSQARSMTLDLDDASEVERYLNREEIQLDVTLERFLSVPRLGGKTSSTPPHFSSGRENRADVPQVLIRHRGHVIGHASIDQHVLLSRFPRSGWPFSLGSNRPGISDRQKGK